MSIDCTGCLDTARTPDTVWYAGTKFSYTVNYVCGTCVSCIPLAERRSAVELLPFSITLGNLHANTGSYGRYQCTGSHQGKAVFSVSPRTILNYLPYGQMFLDELYPFYCIDEYVAEFMKIYMDTKNTDPSAREKAVKIVKSYGPPIAAWYGVEVTQGTDFKKIEKDGRSSYSIETKITEPETEALMKVLEKKFL